jgi:hypothetical protein
MAMTYTQEQQLVKAVIDEFTDEFGLEFGLRAFPGKKFRISADKSFYSEFAGGVQIVVQAWLGDGMWMDFGRDTAATLRKQIVTA